MATSREEETGRMRQLKNIIGNKSLGPEDV